jgi:DNA-binding NarL/FixJ family response regulator
MKEGIPGATGDDRPTTRDGIGARCGGCSRSGTDVYIRAGEMAMLMGVATGRQVGLEDVPRTKVLVADDHAMVREGMAEILSLNDDIEVVAQARDGREAVALAKREAPDVVILDVEMPVMGAQAALRRLLELSPPPKVVIVTVFAERRLVSELLGLGASAFLSKSASSQDLISTVLSVARAPHGDDGDTVSVTIPREDYDEPELTESELSQRETQILRLVARGTSNKEAAKTLHLSETTVKRHLSNVYAKLGVHTRGEAVSKAVSEGWISYWDVTRDG